MSEEELSNFEAKADEFWDAFYDIHQNKFFKDRHWLFTEFPELGPPNRETSDGQETSNGDRRIFEIGCGVGNTILPILKYNTDEQLQVFGCDFSPKAIDILANHREFDASRCKVFVLDATSEEWNVPFEPNSLDAIVLIFVLSAIHPQK